MKKHKKALMAGVLLAGVLFCLWYARPLTLEELTGVAPGGYETVTMIRYEEDGLTSIVLAPENTDLTVLLSGQTFRRSVWGLVPSGFRSQGSGLSDVQWMAQFLNGYRPDPEGAYSGADLLEVSGLSDRVEVYYHGQSWVVRPTEKGWIDQMNGVVAGLSSAPQP